MIYLENVSDFKNYCVKNMGMSSYQFECWESAKNAQPIPQIVMESPTSLSLPSNTTTPYIIEQSVKNMTQMDIFSRLSQERIMYVQGVVEERMSSIFIAQLLYFDMQDKNKDIVIYLDSPGGGVKAGLSMVDTMNLVSADKQVTNVGLAASMGSVLLSNGTKGKRKSLRHSRVMLHQISFGASGNIQDVEISTAQARRYNDILFNILGNNMGKTQEELLALTNRDYWLNSDEALEMDIIDEIIG